MKNHSTARAALHLLAKRKLAPTPDNYAAVYYEILGTQAPQEEKPQADGVQDNNQELVNLVLTLVEAVSESAGDLANILGQRSIHIKDSIDSIGHTEEKREVLSLVDTVSTAAKTIHASVEETRAELVRSKRTLDDMRGELAEAKSQMMHDPLTGARNRFGMEIMVSQEISRSRRSGSKLSLAMADLDHFKQINDTYGHEVGDDMLRYFAHLTRGVLRETDYLFRYGGEEFLMLLPIADGVGAAVVLDRLKQKLAKAPPTHKKNKIKLTFSAGVTEMDGSDSPQALIQRADYALYQAKQQGRNRIVVV